MDEYKSCILVLGQVEKQDYVFNQVVLHEGSMQYQLVGSVKHYQKPLFKHGKLGDIMPCFIESNSISYDQTVLSIGSYNGLDEQAKELVKKYKGFNAGWRIKAQSIKQASTELDFKNYTLGELKTIYKEGHYTKRQYILAEIIRIITS